MSPNQYPDEELDEVKWENAMIERVKTLEAKIAELEDTVAGLEHHAGTLARLITKVEVSDNGQEFCPNAIHSCRIIDIQKIQESIEWIQQTLKENEDG
jgi:hypothetical protein